MYTIFNIRFWVSLIAVFFVITTTVFAQQDVSKDILVYFASGVERGNAGQPVRFTSAVVQSTLTSLGLNESSVESAFPHFTDADTLTTSSDGREIKLPNMGKIFRLKVSNATDRGRVIDALKKMPEVLFAEADGRAGFDVIPNDQYFSYQWSLQPGTKIRAPEAWNIYTGNTLNKIAIIDGGVDATHPDLSGKVSGHTTLYGYHGTHVAGIAAAKTNNTTGIAGVDWNTQILAKAFSDATQSGDAYLYQIITEAVNEGAVALNNSWKLLNDDGSPGRFSTTVRLAFSYAYKQNRVAVATIGNTGNTINTVQYPGSFGQGIIAVGASDQGDNRANFSTYGSAIDVVAPGVSILSTFRNGIGFSDPNYDYLSGTSMAAPHVTGLVSLLKGYNSNLSNDDIEHIIQLCADDVNSATYPGWDQYLGYGRINVKKALDFLRPPYTMTRTTSTGGTIAQTQSHQGQFYGMPGAPDGYYIGNRHEVRKHVSFSSTNIPYVWGRGVPTVGYAPTEPSYSNYTMGYCEVVPGTLTTTGVDLRTWVYEVSLSNGSYYNWYPARPENVVFAYTVLSPSDVTINAPVVANWNMVGIPNVVHDFAKNAVYPTSISTASRWDPNTGQYVATDPLSNGVGYWIKFPNPPGTVPTTGAPIYSQAMSVIVGAASAWNMIGSISKPVATSAVVQNPPNIVIPPYYKYNNGYVATTTLDAGLGFWVKVSGSGTLTLSATPPKLGVDEPFASLDRFIVKDANGGSQEMYVRNRGLSLGKVEDGGEGDIELPPDPPADFFNVRFKSGNYVQSVDPSKGRIELPVLVKSAVYPLTVEWDIHAENGVRYWVTVAGKAVAISGTGSLVIENQRESVVMIEAEASTSPHFSAKPAEYSLIQNYPNPFNPSTTIFYTLPESKHVKLVIYDVLGKEVATLVDGIQDAGYKSVVLDATKFSSGVYFYRLLAGTFTDVKKMLLAK